MKILFVSPFLGEQFIHLINHLLKNPLFDIFGICFESSRLFGRDTDKNFKKIVISPKRSPKREHDLFFASNFMIESGEIVADFCEHVLKKQHGFIPDIIYGAQAGGLPLFLKDLFGCPLFLYSEIFFDHRTSVSFFNKNISLKERLVNNSVPLLLLNQADTIITPSSFQKEMLPPIYHPITHVIHDGIDTDYFKPESVLISLNLSEGTKSILLQKGQEIILFLTRHFEPQRGFEIFLRAIPLILKKRKNATIIIVGSKQPYYFKDQLCSDLALRKNFEKELGVFKDQVFFIGQINNLLFSQLLQISTLYIYLSSLFHYLSWSFLEAMSSEIVVVASNNRPVSDVIVDNENGFLVPFDDSKILAEKAIEVCQNGLGFYHNIKKSARETILRTYDNRLCVKQIENLLIK